MRIIAAPAKKMNMDLDGFAPEGLPRFLEKTRVLLAALREMTPEQLQKLWKCSDALAALNVERLADMDLERRLTPAVMAYEGLQYRYLAPGVLETEQLDYLRCHLRILSGFYGLLSPFDGVTPYRLEMQAKLRVEGCRDLYGFWGSDLARALAEETDLVINLASREYSRAVEPFLPASVRFVTCTFGEEKDGKVVEKGGACKMARGQMTRWMAQEGITRAEDLKEFRDLDYRFAPARSGENHLVFLKEPAQRKPRG